MAKRDRYDVLAIFTNNAALILIEACEGAQIQQQIRWTMLCQMRL